MKFFFKVFLAEMKKQHRNYFFSKTIYISLFIWPVLKFITAYYNYKPFRLDRIAGGLGYINEDNLIVFVLVGYTCLMFFTCFIQSAWLFSMERTYGTLELVYMTPASRLAFIMGNAASSLLESVCLFIVFALGILIFNSGVCKAGLASALFGFVLLMAVALLWGMLLNALFLFSRDSGFLYTVLQGPMEIFSGINVPTVVFPVWAAVISAFFPLTYVAEMLRRVFIRGDNLIQIRGYAAISLLMGIVMLLVTKGCLKLGEQHARKTGNMALF